MSDSPPRTVARVKLRPDHVTTGNTNHYVDGVEMPRPAELQIVTYGQGAGYYLLYCDAAGVEVTDTYHDTGEQAIEQAGFEFGVRAEDWTWISSGDVQQRSTATPATEPGWTEPDQAV